MIIAYDMYVPFQNLWPRAWMMGYFKNEGVTATKAGAGLMMADT